MKTVVVCLIPEDKTFFEKMQLDHSNKLQSKASLKLPSHTTIVS